MAQRTVRPSLFLLSFVACALSSGEAVTVQWSPWTEWSACSLSCEVRSDVFGEQSRQRICEASPSTPRVPVATAADPDVCIGEGQEIRRCSGGSTPCPESATKVGEFSPWSNWTPCIRLCGNRSEERRLRNCRSGPGACDGPLYEARDCTPITTPSPRELRPGIRVARFVMGEQNLYAMEGSSGMILCCTNMVARTVQLKLYHSNTRSQLVNDSTTTLLHTSENGIQATISPLTLNDTGAYSCFTRDDPNLVSVSTSIFVRTLPTGSPATSMDNGSTRYTGINQTQGPDVTVDAGDRKTKNDDFLVIIIPIMACILLLVILLGLACFIHRRVKAAGRGAQAVASSNHIINKVEVVDNRKLPIHPSKRPSCIPYLSRSRQPLALQGGISPHDPAKQNCHTYSFMPNEPADRTDTFGHIPEPFPPVDPEQCAKVTGKGAPPDAGRAPAGAPDLGHSSTHRLNVYSPAEAEREYSKSYEKNLKSGHLSEVLLDPNITPSSLPPTTAVEVDNGIPEFSEDDEEENNMSHHLKKIKSTAEDEDELFRDIAIACESQSIDINDLLDSENGEGGDPAGNTERIVRAISYELARRRSSSDGLKSPVGKVLSTASTFTTIDYNPSDAQTYSPEHGNAPPSPPPPPVVERSGGDDERRAAPDATRRPPVGVPEHVKPGPSTRQCFEDFARATVTHVHCSPAMGQINTQSLPRTGEHTDTLERSDMTTSFSGNPDTMKRPSGGLLSPTADVPVTVL